ncbi:MAG: HAD family hydrolase [Chlorobi bacterium]|nr:HAD family hydrolase [Chlorobiota bacterium]
MGIKKAIFLDRDGVVNKRLIDDYVKRWDEFRFMPGVVEVLPDIHAEGYLVILITNQRGIGRGVMTRNDLHQIHRRMQEDLLIRTGHQFDAMYVCSHDNSDGCDCRKPAPGMLLHAAKEFQLDLQESWMIGDSESDIEAGINAGCRTAKIGSKGDSTKATISETDLRSVWNALKALGSRLHPIQMQESKDR